LSLKASEVLTKYSPIFLVLSRKQFSRTTKTHPQCVLEMRKKPQTTKDFICYAHLLPAANMGHDIKFYVSLLFYNNSIKCMAN